MSTHPEVLSVDGIRNLGFVGDSIPRNSLVMVPKDYLHLAVFR